MTKRKVQKPQKDWNVYPPGWGYRRAMAIAKYYDARKDQMVLDVTRVFNPCGRFSELTVSPVEHRQHGLKSRVTRKRS